MAKKQVAKTATKKHGAPEGRLDRKGDPDLDIARARSLDGDTANDDAGDGVQDLADDADVEADGENDTASGEDDAATRTAASGYAGARAAYEATTVLEGGQHEVLTEVIPQEGDDTLPPSKKHYGIVRLRTADGDEIEFGVPNPDTARHLANVFSAAADELSRRRA